MSNGTIANPGVWTRLEDEKDDRRRNANKCGRCGKWIDTVVNRTVSRTGPFEEASKDATERGNSYSEIQMQAIIIQGQAAEIFSLQPQYNLAVRHEKGNIYC